MPPDYEIKPIYWRMNGVYMDGNCIGVVFASCEWPAPYKRVFFCFKTSRLYFGQDDADAVDGYIVETYVKT